MGKVPNRPLRRLIIGLALIVIIIELLLLAPRLTSVVRYDDFAEYWAAGRLNLQGFNPYAPDQIALVQRSLGRLEPLLMFNPPHALVLAMPFATLSYATARLAWLLLNITAIAVSARWIWGLWDQTPSGYRLALAVSFLFAPTITALVMGQISGLILLGLAGFLHFHRKRQPWIAGAFLSLVLLKPQWMYLLWPALVVWSIADRQFRVLIAACATFLTSAAVAAAFNPQVVGQYVKLAASGSVLDYLTPTIGGALRIAFGLEHTWFQFAPVLIGLSWLAVFLFKNRGLMNWQKDMPVIVLVSALTSSFGWTYDHVVLLVPLLPAVALLRGMKGNPALPWLVSTAIVLNISGPIMSRTFYDQALWWQVPAWCLWCLAVLRAGRKTRLDPGITSVPSEGLGG